MRALAFASVGAGRGLAFAIIRQLHSCKVPNLEQLELATHPRFSRDARPHVRSRCSP